MKKFITGSALALMMCLPLAASAHERHQFRINGEVYEFTIGSLNEPISVDDKTGLELSVREVHQAAGAGEEVHHSTTGAVSGLEETLKVELIAGDLKKTMDIVPVFGVPGSYKNTFYPTVATTFSYRIFGAIDDTPIDFTAACTPAGHARAAEDTSEVEINDQVTRILKTGGFGCPVEKADLGFPEKSAAVISLAPAADAASAQNWATVGTGLGLVSLLLAGYAGRDAPQALTERLHPLMRGIRAWGVFELMKKVASIVIGILGVFSIPLLAHAHASPVDYQPQSSAQLDTAPAEVRIRFSERVEPGASRILVEDESGTRIHQGDAVVDPRDSHFLSVPVREADKGTYFVTWSVVSSDDGHFTKGGYAYFVGTAASGTAASVPQVQIVQLSALPEAMAIFIELLGNSFLWGALVLFALVLRPLLKSAHDAQRAYIARACRIAIGGGVLLILIGGGIHLVQKTIELANLHGISVLESLPLYLATVSGSATVVRAIAAVVFAALFLFSSKKILSSMRFTWNEAALFLILCVFAYYRAKVSHATANPFFPELSITINFFHLIGKGLWEGLVGCLSAMYLSRTLRPLMPDIFRRTFALLSIAFGIAGTTGAYIVWLHLKDFGNISTTLWGERFIPLLVSALLAALLLVYHVAANRFRPALLNRFLPYTLPAEFAFGVLVVFFSSLMIITSPPIENIPAKSFTADSNGLTIDLAPAPYEDGKALLSVSGTDKTIQDPIVMIGEGEGGLVVDVERRFNGGYVFPVSVLMSGEPRTMNITASQEGGYDARASFSVSREDLDPVEEGHGRRFDAFTLVMMLCGLAAAGVSIALHKLSTTPYQVPSRRNSPARYAVAFCGALIVASQFIGLGNWAFANDYKKECIADGNGWHIMLPTKNGIPVSSMPREGCMALNSSFHLPDPREYRFLKDPDESTVEFGTDLTKLQAGVPASLDFSIRDKEGNPALLSVQHERIVHFIVVSKDMREFHHLHPDDSAPLPSDAVRNATFSVPFTFPKSGEYILALDYTHGLTPESKQFRVNVSGDPRQSGETALYPSEGTFDGYDVSVDYSYITAGEPANVIFEVAKDGKPVTDLSPYLAAAMHVAVVKNDLTEFAHSHGEVHPPGAPVVPVTKSNVHQHAPPPPRFGGPIDAHPIFPTPGIYTVFGQFMHDGKVTTSRFTVRVDE